eukprot:gb/GECG01004013.1/.p1 GENE.gb/GECG01004013.1/~~gb/GECG01004013.1/.p1  ORF type:complete len:716 (+),score=77.44 gb/GECG01004013.1/:1-2148(+)
MGAYLSGGLYKPHEADSDASTGSYSAQITQPTDHESGIYRNAQFPSQLLTQQGGIRTLYENFQQAARQHLNKDCIGSRRIDSKTGAAGPFEWMSYDETASRVTSFGSGLVHMGLEAGDFVGIYSLNRPEWFITEHACNAYSLVNVPLYDTLGADALEFIVNQSRLRVIVCSGDKIPTLLHNARNMPSLQYIIEMDYQGTHIVDATDPEEAEKAVSSGITSDNKIEGSNKALVHGILNWKQLQQIRSTMNVNATDSERAVQVTTMSEVHQLGQHQTLPHNPPNSNDLATVCYTSGTTGNPKGVMLTHGNFCAALAGATAAGVEIYPSDIHLSYLPLAHVFERLVQLLLVYNASAIGFFQGDVNKLVEDLQELRPTIFPSVPRLYNRIYDKVIQGVVAAGGTKKALFDYAFAAKKSYLVSSSATTHAIWDRLVFKKIRDMLGGRIRLLVTGSAPMSAEVKYFLQIAFCCPIIEGYGLTETVGIGTTTPPAERSPGQVGAPAPCDEVKLVDIPDMGYTHTDTPCPRGELCVRGPNVFVGYYKNAAETSGSIDRDGWFHTGDVALMNKNGTVSIIDRKKNIFKLSQGEYVAPEKIENVYTRSSLVAQAFVYGDSLQPFLVGVVVPDPEVAEEWAKSNNMPTDVNELCRSEAFRSAVMDTMNQEADASALKGFERVKDVVLEPEMFSVENGMLTPTFKLKRHQLKEKYSKEIERMYSPSS